MLLPLPFVRTRRYFAASLLVLLALSAGGWQVPAAADGPAWPDEFRAGQFWYHADFPLAPYRELLANMPAQHAEVIRTVGIQPSSEAIHVFLFRQKNTYEKYLRQYFPEVPSRKALFIKSQGRGPGMVFAYLGDDFEIDIRHECTHAMLNAALPMVPLWLDEGIAEYFETAAEDRASASPHMKLVQWSARLSQLPKIEDLEQIGTLNEMTRSRYRHAWAWAHFLIHGPPAAREELSRYLLDIQSLTPPDKLSRRLRARLPDLDQQFADHFLQWKPE